MNWKWNEGCFFLQSFQKGESRVWHLSVSDSDSSPKILWVGHWWVNLPQFFLTYPNFPHSDVCHHHRQHCYAKGESIALFSTSVVEEKFWYFGANFSKFFNQFAGLFCFRRIFLDDTVFLIFVVALHSGSPMVMATWASCFNPKEKLES